MKLRDECAELEEVTKMIRSKLFGKYVIAPLKEKQEAIKRLYFVDDVKESWKAGGEYTTLKSVLALFDNIENDFRNKTLELRDEETLQSRASKN